MGDEEEVHESAEGEEEGDGEDGLTDERQIELVPLGSRQVHFVVALDVDVRQTPEDERRREQHQHHQCVPENLFHGSQ